MMAQDDFPYCTYCASTFRRFHAEIVASDDVSIDVELTCYDCGETVVVRYINEDFLNA